MGRKEIALLIGILIVGIMVRSAFFLYFNDFSSDSYYHIRHIADIQQTLSPGFDDALSYGGKTVMFPPLYHYLFAILLWILPLTAAHHLIAVLLATIVYAFSLRFTKPAYALLSAAYVFFVPAMNRISLITVSPRLFMICLMIFHLYLLPQTHKKHYAMLFIATSLLLPFTDAMSILLIFVYAGYVLFLSLLSKRIEKGEIEMIFFSVFVMTLTFLITYKSLLVKHGVGIIWGNVPSSLMSSVFAEITFLDAINGIGLFSLLCGGWALTLFIRAGYRSKEIALLLSVVTVVGFAVMLQLIRPFPGLAIVGITLTILVGPFLHRVTAYLHKTKLYKQTPVVIVCSILLLFLVGATQSVLVFPKLQPVSPIESEMFTWMEEHLPDNATVLAPVEFGHLISGIGKKKNVIDTNFLGTDNIDERFADVETIYTTSSRVKGIFLMDRYDADYILVQQKTPPFIADRCFDNIHTVDHLSVFHRICDPITS